MIHVLKKLNMIVMKNLLILYLFYINDQESTFLHREAKVLADME